MAQSKRPYLWPLLLLLVANSAFLADVAGFRFMAALLLLAWLPGWVWLAPFGFRPAANIERLTMAPGLALALTILGAMLAVYLPGPLTAAHLLVTGNAIIITGMVVSWWPGGGRPVPSRSEQPTIPNRYALGLLLGLILLTAALRLFRLGYAEFHEDETEALMLGVRLLQGEDYALFLHRKGPAQMLLPISFWLLTGSITESLARLPFALSSLTSAILLFLVGRRWFGWKAGLIAGLLWAINGYAVAFGRMVQYQALIFFLGPLAIYALYLAWQEGQPRRQILAAILLAVALLAHFDALLLLPAAAYLGWNGLTRMKAEGGRRKLSFLGAVDRSFLAVAAIAVVVFLSLLAAFYVPYFLDPEFQNTAAYLTGSRVKPGLLYNNLALLRQLDKDYSSHFYLPLLALGVICFAGRQSRRYTRKWRWGLAAAAVLSASTIWLPDMWRIGSLSLALLPWLATFGLLWLPATVEVKTAWLMFGAPFIGYVFLVEDPRTHVYILYPGAVLLAGGGLVALAGWLNEYPGRWKVSSRQKEGPEPVVASPLFLSPSRLSLLLLLIAGLLLGAAITAYQGIIFLSKESTLSQLRAGWDNSLGEAISDDLPGARSYFGYPKREGWKAIGALRAEGKFPRDFRSVNEDFIIPIWYNYGQPRSCYTTPAHVFIRAAGEEVSIPDAGYGEVGWVEREGEKRLLILAAGGAAPANPPIYALADYEARFDRLATPTQFTRQVEPAQPLETEFGPAIKLVGYDLLEDSVAPGETLHLNLYWQALERPAENYRAFVHLTDGTTLWAQQDDNPACRLPTSIWRPGQRGIGQFRLPVDPDTPPGRYPLIIGLYQADTLERLKITAGAGHVGDDFLWLGDVVVETKGNDEGIP